MEPSPKNQSRIRQGCRRIITHRIQHVRLTAQESQDGLYNHKCWPNVANCCSLFHNKHLHVGKNVANCYSLVPNKHLLVGNKHHASNGNWVGSTLRHIGRLSGSVSRDGFGRAMKGVTPWDGVDEFIARFIRFAIKLLNLCGWNCGRRIQGIIKSIPNRCA